MAKKATRSSCTTTCDFDNLDERAAAARCQVSTQSTNLAASPAGLEMREIMTSQDLLDLENARNFLHNIPTAGFDGLKLACLSARRTITVGVLESKPSSECNPWELHRKCRFDSLMGVSDIAEKKTWSLTCSR